MMAGPRIGPSELFRLRWEDVDLDAGIIRMPNARKGARAESRLIPVRDDVLPELRRWWEEDAKIDCPWVIHWQVAGEKGHVYRPCVARGTEGSGNFPCHNALQLATRLPDKRPGI